MITLERRPQVNPHQNNFLHEVDGRPVDDGVDCPEQGRPSLVVEDDDDAGGRQQRRVRLGLAPGNKSRSSSRILSEG